MLIQYYCKAAGRKSWHFMQENTIVSKVQQQKSGLRQCFQNSTCNCLYIILPVYNVGYIMLYSTKQSIHRL